MTVPHIELRYSEGTFGYTWGYLSSCSLVITLWLTTWIRQVLTIFQSLASKVVAGGQGWGKELLDWWGKWEKQIWNFQPIKCEINLTQSHGDSICPLKALYVDIFFVFFLTQKSLWTGCVVFIGCSGIICALCMRVIHICSAMKTSLCLECMGDSRKLLRMRHVA